ncbi:tripartite tricarboxylate transporter substrate binding protein [Sporosarcina luteola]|uniref:tripartite tricarboxylate transporter substrate binding protein n=1 Tax=Sporosarcina luteola TaxID=582850 RepID=UPI00203D4308|nr:tripartite tricarboxylate transporter substrate binding protein [Sporosarcina luteola]MCM3636577.1 tripartite tricarboxylate transporter substrate binding protein [Sporosarcina luteola]
MRMRKSNLLVLSLIMMVNVFMAACSEKNAEGADNEYPKKPIEVIVAFNAGGGTDVAARTILNFTEKHAGTSFAVINKPGAAGEIGFTALAGAPTDGYTIGMINPPTTLLHPIQRPDEVKYNLDDYALIANIVSDPGAFVVNADSPINTLDELFEAAKDGKLNMAYGGPGTSEALTLRRTEEMKGIEFNKIPFEGTSPAVAALMGGHVDVLITNASEIISQYEDKKIKVLAVGSDDRVDLLPDVPTYKEEGLELTQVSMRGLAAPKGISKEQQEFLAEAIRKTMEDEEFIKKAKEMALPLDYKGPDEYKEFLENYNNELTEEFEKNPW